MQKNHPWNNSEAIDFSKRKTLFWATILLTSWVIPSVAVAEALWGTKRQRSIELVWLDEVSFFEHYFWVDSSDSHLFASKVQTFQSQNWLKRDGIIWQTTLKNIYMKEYQNHWGYLWDMQKVRLQAFSEVGQNYKNWRRYVTEKEQVVTLTTNGNPNVFNKGYYFGYTEGMPYAGSFINEDLIWKIPQRENTQWVRGYLKKIQGLFVICIYVNGNLVLASYSSPGNTNKYWLSAETPRITKTNYRVDDSIPWSLTTKMHYISWWSDSVRNTPNKDGTFTSDYMPYACGIDTSVGIYTHAWYTNGKPLSHWCPRLPCHYAKWVFEIFKKFGEIHWDTNWGNYNS